MWTGNKSAGPKAVLCSGLVKASASIDWPRIHRWRTYSVDDPGEDPDEDVVIREWLMDRFMHLQIQAGKIVIDKHFKVRHEIFVSLGLKCSLLFGMPPRVLTWLRVLLSPRSSLSSLPGPGRHLQHLPPQVRSTLASTLPSWPLFPTLQLARR